MIGRPHIVVPLLALLAGAPSAAPRPAGTYRVAATARIQAKPMIDREQQVDATAVLAPGPAAGTTRVGLASEGYRCELVAHAARAGELAFDPGQRCAVTLAEPTVRGRVEARLADGRGRLDGDRLELDLRWDVSGDVSLLVGGRTIEVMGREVDVPGGWAPEVPVRGTASTRGAGRRVAPDAARR